MKIKIINPINKKPISLDDGIYSDQEGNVFPFINGVLRISKMDNYTNNFGLQWNKFDKTQLDRDNEHFTLSKDRFFNETGWKSTDLKNENILEVGSGAGRFTKVLLLHTEANLYSIDFSDSVTANYKNNGEICPERLHLFQSSVYEMPFENNVFDKIFCLGVLQHTPNFEDSIKSIVSKLKIDGEIVVDFYPINGWWTKIHAKYFFRLFTIKIENYKLLKIIEFNIDWLIKFSTLLINLKLGVFTRLLPLVDLRTIPKNKLTESEYRNWVILDTFDMFSPQYDNPQKISDVSKMFEKFGVKVTFSDYIEYSIGCKAAVVRGIKYFK